MSKNEYDLIVIGGGVSGLYSIYKYLENQSLNNKPKILLLESSNRLGGRLHTIKKKSQIYEGGGARFSEHHKLLFELIKKFNLESKLIPIKSEKVFISSNKPGIEVPVTNQLDKALYELDSLIQKKNLSDAYLLSKTFYEIANELSPKLANEFSKYYPYYSEVYVMNARDALISLKRDFTSKTPYFILNGGIEQIIKKLYLEIKKQNGILDVFLNTPLTDIKIINLESNSNDNLLVHSRYQIESENKKFIGHKLLLAIPSMALLSIPFIQEQKFKSLLKLVTPQPLFRIYAKYKIPWLSKHIITDSSLNYIIPYNNEGLIMISYTDGPETEIWYKYYLESKNKLVDMLHKKIKEIMPEVEIPELEWIDACPHWTNGCHYWKPRKTNLDSELLEAKIRHPMPNMWIVGEAFSNYQAWIEGSLDTSNKAIKEIIGYDIISNNMIGGSDKNKKFKMEEVQKHNKKSDAWMVINKKVYDVTSWIPNHPGGMIIMNGVGKDATELFRKVGHDLYAKNKLKTFQIGILDK